MTEERKKMEPTPEFIALFKDMVAFFEERLGEKEHRQHGT